jgi:two-component system KDP operon response regulator KdpE
MTHTRPKLLVIDDEPTLGHLIRSSIEPGSFDLEEASTGTEGMARVASGRPDVVLLDLMLPDVDGFEVARQLRAWTEVPIIVVSARHDESDKVVALDAGADDYLTKPFSMGELFARVRVALRHGRGSDPLFEYGGLKVDMSTRKIWRNGVEVHLTPYEFRLLCILIKSAGKVVTHERLLREVWGEEYVGEVQYLRVYMGQLRHKLEQIPARPRLFATEPGVGYRLRTGD